MTVGHAIEYLVDSRLLKQDNSTTAEREALAILLKANLSVYNEGTEIRPLGSRFAPVVPRRKDRKTRAG